jgi:hypothetical protein
MERRFMIGIARLGMALVYTTAEMLASGERRHFPKEIMYFAIGANPPHLSGAC